MKMLITLLFVASTAQAESLQDTCEYLAGLAESVMERRQAGLRLSDTLIPPTSPEAKANNAYVMLAYERPRMHTPELRSWLVNDFRNMAHISCLKSSS